MCRTASFLSLFNIAILRYDRLWGAGQTGKVWLQEGFFLSFFSVSSLLDNIASFICSSCDLLEQREIIGFQRFEQL